MPLGELVGRGGEGEVYAVGGRDDLVAKLYTGGRAPAREQKIRAMLDADLACNAPLVSYPSGLLLDDSGRFAGFLMRRVMQAKPLHKLYKPVARKQHFPKADYRFLVHVALNVAKAVASVHRTGCVIGDVNESGVLVTETGKVALIDADSFQIEWGGRRFVCEVGKPEYTAPELQNRALRDVVRTTDHDAFALAVVVFQLLWMGRHPFSGIYAGSGEMPLEKAISERRFAYSVRRRTEMSPPPGAARLDTFPPVIAEAFERAFDLNGERPGAEEWVAALHKLCLDLKPCRADPLHHHPSTSPECPWCAVRRDQGVEMFTAAPLPVGVTPKVADWSGGFDLVAVWRAIERVTPPPAPAVPAISGPSQTPSAKARSAKRARVGHKLIGVLSIVAAIGVVFAAPAFWPVWIGLGWFGLARSFGQGDESQFRKTFDDADRAFAGAVGDWMAGLGTSSFLEAKAELADMKQRFEGLSSEQAKRLEVARKERRDRHLRAFLEQFQISRFRIKGIARSKAATLASFGIETAAEVERNRVLTVPGFGPVNSQPLLDWRRRLEARFVYDPKPNGSDLQRENLIRTDIATKAAKLRLDLSSGPQRLAKLAAEIAAQQSAPPPLLTALRAARDQAEADLRHLGISVPSYASIGPTRAPAPPSPSSFGRKPTLSRTTTSRPKSAPSSSAPTCPRCQSSMIKRTARRGRNAGGQFWGCSRYPGCKGTRSI